MRPFHTIPLKEVVADLGTGEEGLKEDKAGRRLRIEGPNILSSKKRENNLVRFLKQFKSSLIIILIVTAIICLFIEDHQTDGIVIFLVVFLNAIMGFVQEFRADNAVHALKRLTASEATVIRGGRKRPILAADLVTGDVIVLSPGMKVPADCRLMETQGVEIDESILTGESLPAAKCEGDVERDVPIPERTNMAYMGTTVMGGEGTAVIVATGMGTEIGKITKMVLEENEGETPLTKQLDKLGKYLAIVALIMGSLLFLISWYDHGLRLDLDEMVTPLLTGISVMVAVIPEGLPVVVALSLTIGMQFMAKKNAIIRKLTGVETLGCTSVICTDKTGTLTKNEMTVRKVFMGGRVFTLTGGEDPSEGYLIEKGRKIGNSLDKDLELLLSMTMLCNDAKPIQGKDELIGSPTDKALYTAAQKAGLDISDLKERYPQIEKIPFTSERKLMITFHLTPDGQEVLVIIKGAPEIILDLCTKELSKGNEIPIDVKRKEWVQRINIEMGLKTYRNIAVAFSKIKPEELKVPTKEDQTDIRNYLRKAIDFTYGGTVSLWDPPRPEVAQAIKLCRSAGIKVVMITGDHEATALAIAQKIGILNEGDRTMRGTELDTMDDRKFHSIVEDVTVYSRTMPHHKMRIVEALKKSGHVVAMTGDGVNDAPALAKADIGIAMGITGSDVAKDASTMILTDDNFATIVSAVEEGRKTYSNIRRFIRYQISTNVGAILLLVSSILVGLPLPLMPVQLLWINILIDGPPAIALGLEPVSSGVMRQPPRPKEERVLKRETILTIISLGIVMAIGTLTLFYWGLREYGDSDEGWRAARTIAFTGFVMFQLFNVLNCKSETETLISPRSLKNRFILLAIGACIVLQMVLLYVPFMQDLFNTVPIGMKDWAIILAVSVWILLVEEILKSSRRKSLFSGMKWRDFKKDI
ncbi:MAG: HAD-IC family P-type ATPase [Candidatus Thermoplasmatota archaeon]|jgi:Ca2+-transporting ATPase|nr:HAD-IC family P-type ATPase [Candidatus Thermoplasmatota archaeon]